MSPLDSFLFLGATAGLLWALWLFLNTVFDTIEDWQAAWREERYREGRALRADQPAAEEAGRLAREKGSSA